MTRTRAGSSSPSWSPSRVAAARSSRRAVAGRLEVPRRRRLRRLARPRARASSCRSRARASGKINDVTLTRDFKARVHMEVDRKLRAVPRGRDVHDQAAGPDRGELRRLRPRHAGRAGAARARRRRADRAGRAHDPAGQPHRPVRDLEHADARPRCACCSRRSGIATAGARRGHQRDPAARQPDARAGAADDRHARAPARRPRARSSTRPDAVAGELARRPEELRGLIARTRRA